MHDRVGQRLGNYRLVRHLGHGGFADTYLGEHAYLKTFAAIKVLQTRLGGPESEAFYNEARIIARLKHPNIVRLLDFGMEDNVPYLVMEFAPNGTLRQFHPRGELLSPVTIIPYVRQVASALQYAHYHKIIHRDVKPENILIGAVGEILLSDFGIAIIAQTCVQHTQNIAGTVTYMAPEQVRGKPQIASDQYALGVVVYEWLCGSPPFSGSYSEVALQHEHAVLPPLSQRADFISMELEDVVHTALAKDPLDRFSNIQDFAAALESACLADDSQNNEDSILPVSISQDDPQLHILTRANNESVSSERPVPPELTRVLPELNGRLTPVLDQSTHVYRAVRRVLPSIPPLLPSLTLITRQPSAHSAQAQPTLPIAFAAAIPSLSQQQNSYLPMPVEQRHRFPSHWRSLLIFKLRNILTCLLLLALIFILSAQFIPLIAARFPEQTSFYGLYTEATSGTPAINDPLSKPDNFEWSNTSFMTGNKRIGGCTFKNGTYYNDSEDEYFITCMAMSTNFNDLAYQVDVTLVQGQAAGAVIRGDTSDAGYFFRIGTDGSYVFQKMINAGDDEVQPVTLVSGSSPALKQGLNQTNQLTVIARDEKFYLYINQKFVDTARDSTFKAGQVGVFTDSRNGSTRAFFRNARIWKL